MANRAPRSFRLRPRIRRGSAGIAAVLLAGSCNAPVIPPPAPSPRLPVATPAPIAAPAPQAGWQDMAIAPGTWRWAEENGRSTARFGAPGQTAAVFTCGGGTVTLIRFGDPGTTQPAPTVVIRTTSASQPNPGAAQPGSVSVALAARDPLLDAIAFSRGRFAIEVQGMAPLALPSWPEVARVIEDCRA